MVSSPIAICFYFLHKYIVDLPRGPAKCKRIKIKKYMLSVPLGTFLTCLKYQLEADLESPLEYVSSSLHCTLVDFHVHCFGILLTPHRYITCSLIVSQNSARKTNYSLLLGLMNVSWMDLNALHRDS